MTFGLVSRRRAIVRRAAGSFFSLDLCFFALDSQLSTAASS
jgi:hypothetical protein